MMDYSKKLDELEHWNDADGSVTDTFASDAIAIARALLKERDLTQNKLLAMTILVDRIKAKCGTYSD